MSEMTIADFEDAIIKSFRLALMIPAHGEDLRRTFIGLFDSLADFCESAGPIASERAGLAMLDFLESVGLEPPLMMPTREQFTASLDRRFLDGMEQ